MLGWLFFLTLLAAVFLVWGREQQARQQALARVRQYCQQEDVQLLDDTLVVTARRLRRLPVLTLVGEQPRQARPSGWQWLRHYRFEFTSTGEERYQGELVLAGRRVWRIRLQPHRLP